MTVEPVWTGPATSEMAVRLSRAALLEVIGLARHRLILVSYAAYKVNDLVDALMAARSRGVDIRFVLETAEASGGALSFDASGGLHGSRRSGEVLRLAGRAAPARAASST